MWSRAASSSSRTPLTRRLTHNTSAARQHTYKAKSARNGCQKRQIPGRLRLFSWPADGKNATLTAPLTPRLLPSSPLLGTFRTKSFQHIVHAFEHEPVGKRHYRHDDIGEAERAVALLTAEMGAAPPPANSRSRRRRRHTSSAPVPSSTACIRRWSRKRESVREMVDLSTVGSRRSSSGSETVSSPRIIVRSTRRRIAVGFMSRWRSLCSKYSSLFIVAGLPRCFSNDR